MSLITYSLLLESISHRGRKAQPSYGLLFLMRWSARKTSLYLRIWSWRFLSRSCLALAISCNICSNSGVEAPAFSTRHAALVSRRSNASRMFSSCVCRPRSFGGKMVSSLVVWNESNFCSDATQGAAKGLRPLNFENPEEYKLFRTAPCFLNFFSSSGVL